MRAGAASAVIERIVRSPSHYWAAMVFDVVAALAWLAVAVWLFAGPPILALVACGAGFVAWGFCEYILHRWVLHGPPSIARVNHAHHHADPDVLIGTPMLVIAIGAAGIWLVLSLAMPAGLAASVVFGLYAGYNGFAIVHHLGHHHPGRLGRLAIVRRLERFHDSHHERQNVNFGITTTIWDRVFGTYQRPDGAGGP
jgi:sterol desaturase/sphingolipid hydroxylase (fatty acid hydroxylase superfamily)